MKRATCIYIVKWFRAIDFNPRPHEEGDAKKSTKRDVFVISIHALMKRATSGSCPLHNAMSHFNPRPHEEGD